MQTKMRLLLISNSGRPFLEHCKSTIVEFLGPTKRVSLITAAPFINEAEFFAKVRDILAPVGLTIEHLDLATNPLHTLAKAEAVMVSGGNTYRLLKRLREAGLIDPLRRRIQEGMPFVGWSAGANIAGPTILTTNDWNVVGLTQFGALNLVPFNLNPHYKEVDPTVAAFAETRDDRIREYHAANRNTVLGVEEQTALWIEGRQARVYGSGRVRRFEAGQAPQDYKAGAVIELDSLSVGQ